MSVLHSAFSTFITSLLLLQYTVSHVAAHSQPLLCNSPKAAEQHNWHAVGEPHWTHRRMPQQRHSSRGSSRVQQGQGGLLVPLGRPSKSPKSCVLPSRMSPQVPYSAHTACNRRDKCGCSLIESVSWYGQELPYNHNNCR